ncbi:MAG TPA: 3-oxoacyl-[acyl-carrier-protein] synthase III C-terminal domain-containing protein [Anaerolineales bacterium]|nr:3-oxoacyl-[acyl-carrier-protein] synthase III C-terminal domain-containing protein [Anaerolineales bacterium]
MTIEQTTTETSASFFDRPGVEKGMINVAQGIPFGMERVSNPSVGIGGVYGAWGKSYDNENLPAFIEKRLGHPIPSNEMLNLSDLGFRNRHHVPLGLTREEHLRVEVEVGAKFLIEAIKACNWEPSEVEGVLIGMSAPVSEDYLNQITAAAGIPEGALKVAIHKACDGSTSSLHLALNPALPENRHLDQNIAESLFGKKVLVGGIEGLSRFVSSSHDTNALQLFGNAAGVVGVIPGQTMKFLAGKSREVFDNEGVLQVQMYYPHSRQKADDGTYVDVTEPSAHNIRIAGLMHEPHDGSSVTMAGPMGMVKLFVRTGVQVVRDVYAAYQTKLDELGMAGKSLAVAIVHHANYKINKLKEKHLQNEGIILPMPWLLSEFGNVSAASNMIAFLRELPNMKPFDHILIDGFGAGTYYDVMAIELGE